MTGGAGVGQLNESPLHADLKTWLARPGDRWEVKVDGYVVDIVRDDLLVEIQTSSFGAMRTKLRALLQDHRVHLVHPIPRRKWIVKLPSEGSAEPTRRRSPKRGRVEDLFHELIRLPTLLAHPGLSLEILLTHEDELRQQGRGRNWRRKGWGVVERRLIEVVESHRFEGPTDLLALLPGELTDPFTNADLAEALGVQRQLAERATYCLRKLALVQRDGKRGRAWLHRRTDAAG